VKANCLSTERSAGAGYKGRGRAHGCAQLSPSLSTEGTCLASCRVCGLPSLSSRAGTPPACAPLLASDAFSYPYPLTHSAPRPPLPPLPARQPTAALSQTPPQASTPPPALLSPAPQERQDPSTEDWQPLPDPAAPPAAPPAAAVTALVGAVGHGCVESLTALLLTHDLSCLPQTLAFPEPQGQALAPCLLPWGFWRSPPAAPPAQGQAPAPVPAAWGVCGALP